MTDTMDRTDVAEVPVLEGWVPSLLDGSGVGEAGAPVWSVEAMADVLADVLAGLTGTSWVSVPAEVLLATVRACERLRSRLDAVELAAIAAIDQTDAAKVDGWASAKDFVTAVTGGPRGSGQRLVRLAHALSGDRSATGQALAAGAVSRDQTVVVVAAVDRLPVNPDLRRAAERLLLDEARDLDCTDLTRLGRRVVERLDPGGVDRRDEAALDREARAAHHARFLTLAEDGIGGVRVTGRGTVEDAAWLKTVLFPLAAPQPTGEPGSCGRVPGTARRAEGCAVSDCAHDGRDPREAGARLWDALVEAMHRLAGTDVLPESHGAKPRITVTVDYDALVAGLGEAGLVDHDTGLSAATARRLACDAEILPIVLGTRSQVLDVGRGSRLVTPGIWQALVARDRHCAFPGCNRMPIACDAHHIHHWADGGTTKLDNLVLLCRTHHTVVHTTPWRVRIDPHDHRPRFSPPPGRYRDDPDLRGRRPQRE
ncbi:MAG: DUF222 domain-containing protein [Nocardioidaceae bacterium]